MNSKVNFSAFFVACCLLFLTGPSAHAEYRSVSPGSPITIGEFVYDDDYVATTTPCNITISDPASSIVVNNASMTADSTGWHYYIYSVPSNAAEGSWPTSMSCGNAGVDLVRMDKTFLVDGTYRNSTSSIATSIWSAASRTLTSFGTLLSDINNNTDARVAEATSTILTAVNNVNSTVLDASSSISSQIQTTNVAVAAVDTKVLSASSSLSSQILSVSSLISALNNISAFDVWNSGTRTLTSFGTLATDIISNTDLRIGQATSTILASISGVDNNILSASSSLATQIQTANSNILSASSTIGTRLTSIVGLITALNNISAADVWGYTTRTLTSFGTLATDINSNTDTRIAQATSTILASISDLDGKVLGASSSLSAQIQIVNTAVNNVNSNVLSASSSLSTQILANSALIQSLNNISAADVWAYSSRSLTDYATSTVSDAVWNRASSQLTSVGSIGKLLADNIDAQISSVSGGGGLTAADVWAYTNRTLSDYSTSSIAAAVWTNSTRELTNYGNNLSAADVWNTLTSTLTTANSIGRLLRDNVDTTITSRAATSSVSGWSTTLTSSASVQVNSTYRTKLTVKNAQGFTATPYSAPTITLYDAARNIVASAIPMTSISTGVYEYTYSVPTNAAQGVWESVVVTQVESGQTVNNNDYWLVAGSPAQVIINNVTTIASTTNNVVGNLTITNEGLAGYEYQYEWCVVTSESNVCGGGDDTYRGTGAKFINPGEDWNTNLTATVPANGNYYFKTIVYFGTERSGSSRTFTMSVYPTNNNNNNGGNTGGGNSGGGNSGGNVTLPQIPADNGTKVCNGADLNLDNKVNLTDFSIMMAFWKTKAPFKNACVDINLDSKVDTKDFSILMGQWGTKGTPFIKK